MASSEAQVIANETDQGLTFSIWLQIILRLPIV